MSKQLVPYHHRDKQRDVAASFHISALATLVLFLVPSKCLSGILKADFTCYSSANDIDFSASPSPSYLEGSHGSGLNRAFKDNAPAAVRRTGLRRFRFLPTQNRYWLSQEWNDKNVPPVIVCGEYRQSADSSPIPESQFFCVTGEPRRVGYDLGLDDEDGPKLGGRSSFFDSLDLASNKLTADSPPAHPEGFDEMVQYAGNRAAPFPHVRVDLFYLNGNIYFNELTSYPFGGSIALDPSEWQRRVGSWLDILRHLILHDALVPGLGARGRSAR